MNHQNARPDDQAALLARCRWRVGGSVGRTVYATLNGEGGHARDDGAVLIGMFDSALLAAEAVDAHNGALERRR